MFKYRFDRPGRVLDKRFDKNRYILVFLPAARDKRSIETDIIESECYYTLFDSFRYRLVV